ncbi:50S ribosomal protein L29 [Acidiferrobacter sp.]|jgi:large subunit ribosomal protein L29|uniref:50S ribosomal protein L29 n=1 Tax=Acidiferrobacter sp. TaxID=1872107 RepID=UPI002603A7B7|nr:50S ribosomal protein L29 [Acidiferrobacter sp.]
MDLKEIRAASIEEQRKELEALREKQFTLRMQGATGQIRDVSEIGKVRRDIARILTVMQQAGSR